MTFMRIVSAWSLRSLYQRWRFPGLGHHRHGRGQGKNASSRRHLAESLRNTTLARRSQALGGTMITPTASAGTNSATAAASSPSSSSAAGLSGLNQGDFLTLLTTQL